MTGRFHRLGAGLAAAIAIAILAAPAAAQCEPEWRDLRGGVDGSRSSGWCHALLEFDDGSGPALYAGGIFRSAGGKPARNVARWDGWSWSSVGDGVPGWITSMTVFDDGTGPALYAGTTLSAPTLVRWDGNSWTTVGEVGPSGGVHALAVFDDGSGPALYAGGLFREVDGKPAVNIARWDGASWSAFGPSGIHGMVLALQVFDDGSGPALYAGGNFFTAGGVPARQIARWDGQEWSALGHESQQRTMDFIALEVHDDGSGPALYGAAFFCDTTGCPRGGGVLRWDGNMWHETGGTFLGWPYVLKSIDDGGGPSLYAGGMFSSIGGEPFDRLARWDGSSWTPVAGGVGEGGFDRARAITTFDEGAGPTLFIGGEFTRAGDIDVSGIAAFGCPPPACYADCDDNGALDVFDFLCFQNLFAAGDPGADCDGSGILDFADFLCYQDAFAAGCR